MLRRKENRQPLPRRPGWRDVSDEFWDAVKRYIPKPKKRKTRQGKPTAEARKIPNGILYVLRTGCQWKMLPREYYAGTTTHRYFQQLGTDSGVPQNVDTLPRFFSPFTGADTV